LPDGISASGFQLLLSWSGSRHFEESGHVHFFLAAALTFAHLLRGAAAIILVAANSKLIKQRKN